jgi:anti-anti-sigma factor
MNGPDYLVVSTPGHGLPCVLRLSGELDLCTREILRAEIGQALDRCPQTLVLDMAELSSIDCSGLSVLIAAHHTLVRRNGRLVLAACGPAVRRLLQVTGADGFLHLVEKAPSEVAVGESEKDQASSQRRSADSWLASEPTLRAR